jgi:hypothetical protein
MCTDPNQADFLPDLTSEDRHGRGHVFSGTPYGGKVSGIDPSRVLNDEAFGRRERFWRERVAAALAAFGDKYK